MAKKKTPSRTIQQIEDNRGALPRGIEGANIPDKFSIPPSTIADVDRAIFNLFEKRLKMEVTVGEKTIPVNTIFAGGERVFLVKGQHPPRDRSGTFILPIVTIRRSGLDQSRPGVISGRGMGQNTGDIIIKKRVSTHDPRYQSLINTLGIKNQDNVASPENVGRTGAVTTRRAQHHGFNTRTGELLAPELGNNIFEIITMPFPHFYTAIYEVTFWTQYVQHMNALLERFMTSYDAQGNQFKLDTDKGYWFVAYVDDSINSDDNFSDYTDDERFVKYKFTIKVPAYLHGDQRYGSGVPFRSFLSAPQISFQIVGGSPANQRVDAPVGSGDIDKFTLSNIERLDKRGNQIDSTREFVEKVEQFIPDPFGGQGKTRLVKVLSRNNAKGESVLSKRVFTVLDDVNV